MDNLIRLRDCLNIIKVSKTKFYDLLKEFKDSENTPKPISFSCNCTLYSEKEVRQFAEFLKNHYRKHI